MQLPTPRTILLDLQASTSSELILELSAGLDGSPGLKDLAAFQRDLLEREADSPTGLEKGCALPHARSAQIGEILLAAGRSRHPVDFGAPDGPARLFFLFGVPLRSISPYLKLVARLSSLLHRESLRQGLLDAPDAEAFTALLHEAQMR